MISTDDQAEITTDHQAEYSYAFVRAVAATAGCSIADPKPDRKSVDFIISSEEYRCPKIDIQVKSTKNFNLEGDKFSYPLKKKNYDDLIADVTVPRILVLVTLPPTPEEWLKSCENYLSLKHCAYWASLKGLPERSTENTVTVYIERRNVFDVQALREIMRKVSDWIEL